MFGWQIPFLVALQREVQQEHEKKGVPVIGFGEVREGFSCGSLGVCQRTNVLLHERGNKLKSASCDPSVL